MAIFHPYGASQVIAVTATDQRIALPSFPATGPFFLRFVTLQGAMTAIYGKLGNSSVTGDFATSQRIEPGATGEETWVAVEGSPTHLSIFCEGNPGSVMMTPGRIVNSDDFVAPSGASQVIAVTATDQRIALPTMPTSDPVLQFIGQQGAMDAIYLKLGNSGVTGDFATSARFRVGTQEAPLVIGVGSETHLSIFCEGNPGNVIMTPGASAANSYVRGGSDVAVPDGGTGASSFTAYTPVCGGTTTTAALQSVASIGNTKQVLASSGSGALPAFVDPATMGVVRDLVFVNNATTPNTKVDISGSEAVLRDTSGGGALRVGSFSLTVDTGTTGANGLDTGTLAASTWYHAWLISNGTTTAALLSTSATAPTMPGGYIFKYRVGAIITNGSTQFVRILQKGNRAAYQVIASSTTPNLPFMASGSSGSITTPTWTAVSVSNYVPTTATRVIGIAYERALTIMVAPNNAYGAYNSTTNPPPCMSSIGANGSATHFDFVLEGSNIYYAANGAAAYVLCYGWVDAVNAV